MKQKYANHQGMKDIGDLLERLVRCGEFELEHESILTRWRKARGEAGMTDWAWWAKQPDDESYGTPFYSSREDAIADILNEYPEATEVMVCQARSWDDEMAAIKAGAEGIDWFADQRFVQTHSRRVAIEMAKLSTRYRGPSE